MVFTAYFYHNSEEIDYTKTTHNDRAKKSKLSKYTKKPAV